MEETQTKRKEAEARLDVLAQDQVDAATFQAQVAALRERWQDWQGALEDPDRDIALSRQLIKKLLTSPVIVKPEGDWECCGTR